MKRLPVILTLCLLVAACTLFRQGGQRPVKGQKTLLQPAGVDSFDFNGLQILHKYDPHPVVTVRLFFRGGVENYPQELEGVEQVALMAALHGGTVSLGGAAMAVRTEAEGARIFARTHPDYALLGLDCHLSRWRESWGLFQETVLRPGFPEADAEMQKGVAQGAAQALEQDGPRYAAWLARMAAFGGSPYGKTHTGTAQSLESLKAADVAHYYRDFLLNKCRMLLVVTGPFDREMIVDRVMEAMDGLPGGNCGEIAAWTTRPRTGTYKLGALKKPLHYLHGIAPAPEHPQEQAAYRIALALVQEALQTELEKNKMLAQETGARLENLHHPYASVWLATGSPARCLATLRELLLRLREQGFTEAQVQRRAAQLSTAWRLTLQDPRLQAEVLGETALFQSWRQYGQVPVLLEQTDAAAVNGAFRKYFTALSWGFAGDTTLIPKARLAEPLVQP